MKIESKLLVRWLEKTTVNHSIDEVRFNFTERGVEMLQMDPPNLILCSSLLKKQAFKVYDAIGEVGVNSTKKLKEFLKRFDGEVTINKKNYILEISGKTRKAEFVLANPESLAEKKEMPGYDDWKAVFDVDSKVFKEVVTNAATVGKQIDIIFETEEKKLKIQTGNDDKFIDELSVPEIQTAGVKTMFEAPLKSVVDVLEDKVHVSFGHKGPMKILMKNELEEFIYFIAPKSDDEDDDEEEENEE